jgi:hypothetical protein
VVLRELVSALLAGDLLTARQWVADAHRADVHWEQMEAPADLTDREMSVAAAVVELLASRAGAKAPSWTETVGGVCDLLVLDPGLEQMPRSLARAKSAGPEPLRKRNIVALPDFLDVA